MAEDVEGPGIDPLILKKKIKVTADAHGGAWKIAYADLVTATMAFFLLLWLLNSTTEEQMTGLSDYFSPPSAAQDTSGIGEVLAGLTAAADDAMRSPSSPPKTSIVIPSYGSEETGQSEGETRETEKLVEANITDQASDQAEQELLDEALSRLRQTIENDPLVHDLRDSILFDVTEEGLEIQLLDFQRREMFEPGTDRLTRRVIRLLAPISGIILEMPNVIAITGHTDSAPQPGARPNYGNWELSGDRAAASRLWMQLNGFPDERLVRVEGKADTDLLDKRNPEDDRNRRISILLLRETFLPPKPAPVSSGSTSDSGDSVPSLIGGGAAAVDPGGLAPPPLPSD